MQRICHDYNLTGDKLHKDFVHKHNLVPDTWIEKDLDENFADGKHPGRKGDSARHGIPKHASLSKLDKIGHGSGRKAQLARWQANMRRGRAK